MDADLSAALERDLDARLRTAAPAPDVMRVVQRGRVRRRWRRAAGAAVAVCVMAGASGAATLDLFDPRERDRATGTAAGVERIGRMTLPRAAHSATLLETGQVLLSGGFSGSTEVYYDSAELFDPVTKTFVLTTPMSTPRTGHASVLLDDGRVLVAGGWGKGFLASAELFDPSTRLFSATGGMTDSRDGFTATLLQDGRVLVAGGFRDGYDSFNRSAEIYDPSTGTFERTGDLRHPRASHTATLLPNGDVVVTGGLGPRGVLRTVEVFDPQTGRFHAAGRMVRARQKHGAVLLDDGTLLLLGGADIRDFDGRLRTAEVYDPATTTSRLAGRMNEPRFKLPAPINLPGAGKVLVVGGADRAEVYGERRRSFAAVPGDLEGALSFPTATLLGDGTVLVTGGYDEQVNATDGAWLFSGPPRRAGP